MNFKSDLHGGYHAFQHVLRNGADKVKEKIRDIFQSELSKRQINEFATLVYYPEEKLKLVKNGFASEQELNQWYTEIIEHMVKLIPYTIQRLVVDHLHVVGDIYDRGSDPDKIMDYAPLKVIPPLDAAAKEIWDKGVDEMLEKNMDSRAALQKIEEDTMAAAKVERDELLKSIGR